MTRYSANVKFRYRIESSARNNRRTSTRRDAHGGFPCSRPSSVVMAVLAQFFWRYYLQNKVMAVLAQFYFGVLAALAQLAVLAQFYFGVSIDPPHPPSIGNGGSGAVFWSLTRPAPGRVCTPKYFFRFPQSAPNASTMRSSGSASSSGLH